MKQKNLIIKRQYKIDPMRKLMWTFCITNDQRILMGCSEDIELREQTSGGID